MVGEEVRWNPNRISNGRYALTSSSSCSSSSSSSSSSPSSSSCLSLSPASESGGECGLDGMELEAARTLACMSRTAVREGGGRKLKRFKNRLPARDWENSNHGWDLASVPEDNKPIKVTAEEKIKVEQISEILPPPCSNSSTNSPLSSGRKAKLILTEAEREARRMRRVLANRESARQTIRRRQALRDGLTKKVSDLSLDNQNMKMEKGQITKMYMSLRNKNKQLKTELAMAIACNIIGAEATSPPPETISSPNKNSFLVNINPPYMPGFCPPWPVIAPHSGLCYDQNKAAEPHNDQNHRENSATHLLSPSKDKIMKIDESHKLDIDLNSTSVIPEASLDALNHCSSTGDEPLRVFTEQTAKFLEAASARRRRKEILKLKHLCGRPIVLHI